MLSVTKPSDTSADIRDTKAAPDDLDPVIIGLTTGVAPLKPKAFPRACIITWLVLSPVPDAPATYVSNDTDDVPVPVDTPPTR